MKYRVLIYLSVLTLILLGVVTYQARVIDSQRQLIRAMWVDCFTTQDPPAVKRF